VIRLAAATVLAVAAFAVPAHASGVSVCVDDLYVSVAGNVIVDEQPGCQAVDLP
jgi:hypothetical protein